MKKCLIFAFTFLLIEPLGLALSPVQAATFLGPPTPVPTSVLYFYHQDHLSSNSVITDENGNVISTAKYQPYGEERSREGIKVGERTYTDQIKDDSTNLMYYNARYYNPRLGIFTQPDQVGGIGKYSYAGGNPIKNNDPSGNEFEAGGGADCPESGCPQPDPPPKLDYAYTPYDPTREINSGNTSDTVKSTALTNETPYYQGKPDPEGMVAYTAGAAALGFAVPVGLGVAAAGGVGAVYDTLTWKLTEASVYGYSKVALPIVEAVAAKVLRNTSRFDKSYTSVDVVEGFDRATMKATGKLIEDNVKPLDIWTRDMRTSPDIFKTVSSIMRNANANNPGVDGALKTHGVVEAVYSRNATCYDCATVAKSLFNSVGVDANIVSYFQKSPIIPHYALEVPAYNQVMLIGGRFTSTDAFNALFRR